MPAYREEREILPTLVSWTRVNVRPGEAELIVVDNANTDRTAEIIRACGARYVHCGEPGVGHARAAGVAAAAESAEYLWLLDADVRLLPPYRRERDLAARSSVLRTSLEFMDIHPTYVGISTGSLTESAHWLYRLAHSFAVRTGRSRRYSCWSGHNQFVRRSALEAIGGIDEEVEWNDDQHRHHELARYAKRTGGHLASANRMPETADPVYHSGRRYATLGLCLRHFREAWSRAELPRDEHGYPVHARNRDWRKVRID
jgi:glycosyltransferase involved in cell wall biosynthesis